MKKAKLLMEFRALNNLIRRYLFFSSHTEDIKSITGNNAWIIRYLADNEGSNIYQKDIEEYFTITRSTASRVLSLMEKKELISRESVAIDARLKRILLTDKARQVETLMTEDSLRLEKDLFKGFSQEEIDNLLSYFSRMKDNMALINNKSEQKE